MMRVITGSARGRRLMTLDGDNITRPTTESTKEALFSMIQFDIEDKKVLDLFAGSGQLGIEALSRGARHCTFIENSKSALKIVEENIKHCGFENSSVVLFSDAVSFLRRKDNFDIAFLDPPYNNGIIEKCLPYLIPLMNDGGIIACETARDEHLQSEVMDYEVYRERNYGKTKLTLYKRKEAD